MVWLPDSFASAQWHQLRMRLRRILLDVDTGASPTAPVQEWRGLMDHRQFVDQPGQASQIVLTCEGGLMRSVNGTTSAEERESALTV